MITRHFFGGASTQQPDYWIKYQASRHLPFGGGTSEVVNFSTADLVWVDIVQQIMTPFKLVLDTYDTETQTGIWGFKGDAPSGIGGWGVINSEGSISVNQVGGLDYQGTSFNQLENLGTIVELSPNLDYLTPVFAGLTALPCSKYLNMSRTLGSIVCTYAYNSLWPGTNSVEIPEHVHTIINGDGFDTPAMWRNISGISVVSSNSILDSRDGCNAVIETSTNTLVFGCSVSSIPSTVTAIGDQTFAACSITSIVIPDNIISIGKKAFQGCGTLNSVVIGTGVTTIGDRAFNTLNSLTEIAYTGTIEQWNAISCDNAFTAGTIIHCSDGDVTL